MLFQSALISLFTFSTALVISFLVALLIKGIFVCIKFNPGPGGKVRHAIAAIWKETTVTSSK